jgi:hypothetical protein
MPALTLELKPRGRRDAAFKAKNHHGSRVALEKTPSPAVPEPLPSVREDFTRAAGGNGAGGGGDSAAGGSGGDKPPPDATRPPSPKRRRRRERDHEPKRR